MILLGLSICSLFGFGTLATVLFTFFFTIAGDAAVLYFKLKFAFSEEECAAIRRFLSLFSRFFLRVRTAASAMLI